MAFPTRACPQLSRIAAAATWLTGEEVPGGFVVPGGDRAERLDLAYEVLDEVARLVERARVLAGPLWRNDRRDAGGEQGLDDARLGVEGLVRQERLSLNLQQLIGAFEIVRLAPG